MHSMHGDDKQISASQNQQCRSQLLAHSGSHWEVWSDNVKISLAAACHVKEEEEKGLHRFTASFKSSPANTALSRLLLRPTRQGQPDI